MTLTCVSGREINTKDPNIFIRLEHDGREVRGRGYRKGGKAVCKLARDKDGLYMEWNNATITADAAVIYDKTAGDLYRMTWGGRKLRINMGTGKTTAFRGKDITSRNGNFRLTVPQEPK